MSYIHLSFHDKRVATYELDDEDLTIGRTPHNDIVIDNPGVSSSHAVIRKAGNAYVIEDLGSKNGTYLKGDKVDRHKLEYGDVITIFKHQLHFVPLVGGDAPPADLTAEGGGGVISQSATLEIDMSRHADLLTAQRGNQMNIELVLTGGAGRSRILRLDKQSYSIGKSDECLIKTGGLMAPAISARLMRQSAGYLLIPERKNEVRVNGMEIEGPCRLENGDEIDMRKLRMLYRAEVVGGG